MEQSLEAEFTAFVAERGQALLRVAHALTGDARSAEDLVQGALAKAYARWPRIHSDAEAYVRKILYHDRASGWRRVGRHREVSVAEVPDWCLFTWLPDGRQVAVARRDPAVPQSESQPDTVREIGIYDATTGELVRTMPVAGVPAGSGAWAPDTSRVLVRSDQPAGEQSIADTRTGQVVGTIPEQNAQFLADGRILGLAADVARLYNESGNLVEQMKLPADFADRTVSVGQP